MPALAEALIEKGDVQLAVATALDVPEFRKENIRNINYYALPLPGGPVEGGRLPASLIDSYRQVLDDFEPDIIHVHGTEYFEGLLTGRGHINCPTVVSIQGIIDVYQHHYWGGIPFHKLVASRTTRDWLRFDGLIEQKMKWARRARFEREMFSTNSAYIGRTLWDRAHTLRLNPDARYHHCDELMRRPFYDSQWDINKITRHSIFASSASYPIKGFHVLIKAVSLLKNEFPDVTIRTPLAQFYPSDRGLRRFWKNRRSSGYARYLTDLIKAEKLEKHIISFPSLDAEGMANELQKAHVFALPSLIENSPNSLAESMLVGTPTISAFVGGIPSMAKDEESVLFFPSGDEAVLAEQISRIFRDDDLACKLSEESKRVATVRHSADIIVSKMLEVYGDEIDAQGAGRQG